MGSYDPNKSQVNADRLAEFIRAPITGDIGEVPGIGAAAQKYLKSGEEGDQVSTTHQLIGKFLMLRREDVDCVEHCDLFWQWLQSKGVNSHRSGIVNAIAEKVNTWIPGTYEDDLWGEQS